MSVRPPSLKGLPRVDPSDLDALSALSGSAPAWPSLALRLERALGAAVEVGTTTVGGAPPGGAGLTAGWMGGLRDGLDRWVGAVHVDSALGQALAARLLIGQPAIPEVRPLLPVEEEALSVLFGVLLSEWGLPVIGETEPADVLERLGQGPVARAMGHLRVDGVAGWVRLFAAVERWPTPPRASRRAGRRERLARSPLARGLEVEMVVRLGTFEGVYPTLLDLEVGDVLLPGEWIGLQRPTSGQLCVAGRPVAALEVSWEGRLAIRLADTPAEEEVEVSDSDASDPTLRTDGRRTLEVARPGLNERLERLEIVLGSARLTLGELLELQPGRTFDLEAPVSAPVDLVLDGRTIGRGELVEVEGRLGVRVIAVSGR